MSGKKRKKRAGSSAGNTNQKPQELTASSSKPSGAVSANAGAAAESTKNNTNQPKTTPAAPGDAAVKKTADPAKEAAAKTAQVSSTGMTGKASPDAKAAAAAGTAAAQAGAAAKSTKDSAAAAAAPGKGAAAGNAAQAKTASTGKTAQTRTGSSGKTVRTGSAAGRTQTRSNRALIIGLLIGAACIILLGIVLYVRFLVPREIHISEPQLTVNVGESAKLSYTILPESADNLEVAWASSDEGIASIDEFGVVTGVSGGACTVAVASGNGKTDICVVTVIDPTEIQKDSLDGVLTYIEEQENLETSEDASASYLSVDQLDDRHDFLIGKEADALLLAYRTNGKVEDMGIDAEYTTYLRIQPKNIETAEVVQKNTLDLYGFPIEMTGSGVINLKTYEYDDPVTLDSVSSPVEGLDATSKLQELATAGVTECVKGFSEFLVEQNFEFGLSEFGLTGFGAIEKDLAENAASGEAEDGAGQDAQESTVSNFEALGQSSPQGDAAEAKSSPAEGQDGSGSGQAFAEFPKAGPTSSTLSQAVDSLAKTSSVES